MSPPHAIPVRSRGDPKELAAIAHVHDRMGRNAGPWALAISLLAHGSVMATAGLVGAAMHEAGADERSQPRTTTPPPRGDTFDIEGLVDAPSGRSAPSPGVDDAIEKLNDDGAKSPSSEPIAPPPPAPAASTPPPPRQVEPEPRHEAPATTPEPAPPPPGPPYPSPPAASSEPDASGGPRPTPPASPSASPSAPDGPSDGDGPGRRYGAEQGPRRGFDRVGPAFARAIARAVNADPVWSELPLGRVGAFELDIAIDADGKIADVVGDEKLEGALAALVRRTRPALFGRFTLTEGGHEGVDTLRITVHLEQRPPPPEEKLRFGATPPDEGPPWKAYFTLESGRHFEALVEVVHSKVR
jgi:hypothetical protein